MNFEPISPNGTTNSMDWTRANDEAQRRGPVHPEELAQFISRLSAMLYTTSSQEYPTCQANWREAIDDCPKGARKYARIVVQCPLKDEEGRNYHRSAYCFINLANGDILKNDGWKKPATISRGNIRVGGIANWWNHALTQYGAAYIR